MKPLITRCLYALSAIALAACTIPVTHEPPNLSALKSEVDAYAGSGEYDKDLRAVAASAESWITRRAARGGENLTIVLDIDETVLSNLDHMRQSDWGYHPTRWDVWVEESDAPAIQPLLRVYQSALQHGVKVVFITGRKERTRRATARNLKACGMGEYDALILRPNDSDEPAANFKSARRQELAAQGYTIIANIGDQWSDLEGGGSERGFKLPNPFYTIR